MMSTNKPSAALEDELESVLIAAAGDTVLWKCERYTVVGRGASGSLWQKHTALNQEALLTNDPVLLCLDRDERKILIPERETRIILTSPRYVMERILGHLSQKGAIDWGQVEDTVGECEP
jgi:hypothetical protein